MRSGWKWGAALSASIVGATFAASATAEEMPWLVRLRAVELVSANKDSTGLDLSINNRLIPEVDVSYFFTPNWATELVLTYPQRHDLRSAGSQIGSLKHLPPTLTLQYHWPLANGFKPYLGAGVNVTRFSDVSFTPAVEAALQPSIKRTSVGLAAQVGLDVELATNLFLNVDVKKVGLGTDVRSAGNKVGEFKVNPWLIGIGIGRRF